MSNTVDEAMQDDAMPTRVVACATAEKNRVAGYRCLPGVVREVGDTGLLSYCLILIPLLPCSAW
jgi:hypothetical protein